MAEPLYRSIVWGFKSIFRGLGMRLIVTGEENIPREGGAVLAINHTSYLDFALAGIPADMRGKRLVRFMAKDSVFKHAVGGPLMRGMHHIPVDRDSGSDAFRRAVGALKDGELVGVFPEATMSRSLEIKEIKNGAVRMARAAGVPLIPMIVFGGQRVISYGVKNFSRGAAVCISVGAPLEMVPGQKPDELTDALRTRMQELLEETLERYPDPGMGEPWMLARKGGSAPTYEEAARIEEERAQRRAAERHNDE